MTKIELKGISKRFGGVTAADNICLAMEAGQRLVVLGSSGAGKTTLLRIIAGLERPDHGEVLLDGMPVTQLPPQQRNVALVSQDYALYPQLNVLQNIEAGLARTKQLTPAARHERIDEVLDRFQIGDLRKRLPAQLSGGQAQRVAFARALVRQPALLLLDEPLSQVDALRREETRRLILSCNREFGTTIVMVTHEPIDAMLLATHIAALNQGRVCQVDAPEQLYLKPTSKAAMELLSPFGVNWLTTQQLAASDEIEVHQNTEGYSRVGIRPEQFFEDRSQLESPEPTPIALSISATITSLRCVGFANMATGTAGNLELKILDQNKTLRPGPTRLSVAADACVWL